MSTTDKSVRHKLGLLQLARQMNNVSKACETLGYSRDSYYRFKRQYDRGGEAALRDMSRRKPVVKNRVPDVVEDAVVEIAFAHPGWGQARVAQELVRRGIKVSSSGVRSIWQRYDLETRTKRAIAIATRAYRERLPLSDAQRQALETLATKGRVLNGHPVEAPAQVCYQGYVHVGDHPVLGPLYQHYVVDAYSRFAFARVETETAGVSPADFLLTEAVPGFRAHGLTVETVRTDRRAPFGGPQADGYRMALKRAGIALTYRTARSASTSDPGTRFQQTIATGFYQRLFRAGLRDDLEDLNRRLRAWLKAYNEERVETAAYCYGNTPATVITTFLNARDRDRRAR